MSEKESGDQGFKSLQEVAEWFDKEIFRPTAEKIRANISYPEFEVLKFEPVEGMEGIKTEPLSIIAFGEMFPPGGVKIHPYQERRKKAKETAKAKARNRKR